MGGNALFQVSFYASISLLEGIGPLWHPVTIETLADGPLLELFSFYVEGAYEAWDLDEVSGIKLLESWCTLVHRDPEIANPPICIAASPQSAAYLHKQNTREGDMLNVECLVFLAHCRESSLPGECIPQLGWGEPEECRSRIALAYVKSVSRISI